MREPPVQPVWPPPGSTGVVGDVDGLDEMIQAIEVDIREDRADLASNNLANILRDLAVTLPRDRLRPAYGDGFGGAPWHPGTAGEHASGRESEEPDDGSRTAHASDAGGPSDV